MCFFVRTNISSDLISFVFIKMASDSYLSLNPSLSLFLLKVPQRFIVILNLIIDMQKIFLHGYELFN